jgi:hypothetical protein
MTWQFVAYNDLHILYSHHQNYFCRSLFPEKVRDSLHLFCDAHYRISALLE